MDGLSDQHGDAGCNPWTILVVYLSVLSSSLYIADTASVPNTTFNTARTTASITTGATTPTLSSRGPTTNTSVNTDGSTSSVQIEDLADREKVPIFTETLKSTNQLPQVEKHLVEVDLKESVKQTGTQSRLMTALNSSTKSVTPTTALATMKSTKDVTPAKITANGKATKGVTQANIITNNGKAAEGFGPVNIIIKGFAALTSPKESPKPKINCKMLRRRGLPLPHNCVGLPQWN